SIDSVYKTILEAVVLVVIIIFLFLRSLRAMMIPLVTIPVSLIGACGLMFAFDFSLNTLTLLSLVLAIGLVVDDAIVMMEKIFDRQRLQDDPRGRRPRGHHHLPVPALAARDDDPAGHDPGLPDRRLRADVRFRFLAEHADAAEPRARDRPRRRRRHRHDGEHLRSTASTRRSSRPSSSWSSSSSCSCARCAR